MAFSYSPKIVTDGLVLCLDAANANSYPGSGNTWSDLSRRGNNTTLFNGPTYNSANGGSLIFDGSNDYAEVLTNGSGSVFDTQTYSIEFWCKPNYLGLYEILWSYDFTTHTAPFYSQHVRIATNSDTFPNVVYFGFNEQGTLKSIKTPNNTVTNNAWIHIIVTKSITQSSIYINGTLSATNDFTLTSPTTYYNQEVWIGRSNFENSVRANIAVVRFYNKVLTSVEVLQNYNATKTRFGL